MYASFLARVLAAIIDSVVLLLPVFILIIVLEPGYLASGGTGYRFNSLTVVVVAVFWAVYKGGMECGRYQATIGKLAMRIYVADMQGKPLSFETAVYRGWPMYILNVVQGVHIALENVLQTEITRAFIFGAFATSVASCLFVLWSPRKQGLHDQILGTLVLKRSPAARNT